MQIIICALEFDSNKNRVNCENLCQILGQINNNKATTSDKYK